MSDTDSDCCSSSGENSPPSGKYRVSRKPSHVDLAKEEIICPMCIGVFSNPRSLQCLHSYCESCIESLLKATPNRDSICCPECRTETAVPEDGVEGLPVNFKLQRFVEILSAKEKEKIARSATFKEPLKLQPKLVDLKCTTHANKALEYYCQECKALVCGQCMLDEHRMHSGVTYANDSLPEHIATLKASLGPISSTLPKASSVLESLHFDTSAIKTSREEAVTVVRSYFGNVHKLLQERERAILESIATGVSKKEKKLTKQQQTIQEAITELQKCIQLIHDIEDNRSGDIRVLLEEQSIKNQIDHHTHKLESIIGKVQQKGPVTFKSPFHADSYFEAQCHNVGESAYEQPIPPSVSNESFDKVPSLPPGSRRRLGENTSKHLTKTSSADTLYLQDRLPVSPDHHSLLPRPRSQSFCSDPSEVVILPPYLEISSRQLLGSNPRVGTVYPHGVCIGKPDSLIVTDPRNNMLNILTPTGKCLESVVVESKGEGSLSEPTAVTTNESGNIFVVVKGTSNKIQKYSPSGKLLAKLKARSGLATTNHLGDPAGITVLPNGNTLVTDAEKSCIHVFDGTGKYQGKLESTESRRPDSPAGITHDNRGNLVIADRGNHCIWVHTVSGRYLTRFGRQGSNAGELLHPFGVATDLDGNIFVSESGNHRISVFTAGGKFMRSFGKKGSQPGMFLYPRHLCVDSQGRLVVADEHNQRVQIFDVKDFIAGAL